MTHTQPEIRHGERVLGVIDVLPGVPDITQWADKEEGDLSRHLLQNYNFLQTKCVGKPYTRVYSETALDTRDELINVQNG